MRQVYAILLLTLSLLYAFSRFYHASFCLCREDQAAAYTTGSTRFACMRLPKLGNTFDPNESFHHSIIQCDGCTYAYHSDRVDTRPFEYAVMISLSGYC
ncbi:hypothetical protein F5Y16DRAFT_356669, partial [Xylariaceae sp. FL0255]